MILCTVSIFGVFFVDNARDRPDRFQNLESDLAFF